MFLLLAAAYGLTFALRHKLAPWLYGRFGIPTPDDEGVAPIPTAVPVRINGASGYLVAYTGTHNVRPEKAIALAVHYHGPDEADVHVEALAGRQAAIADAPLKTVIGRALACVFCTGWHAGALVAIPSFGLAAGGVWIGLVVAAAVLLRADVVREARGDAALWVALMLPAWIAAAYLVPGVTEIGRYAFAAAAVCFATETAVAAADRVGGE